MILVKERRALTVEKRKKRLVDVVELVMGRREGFILAGVSSKRVVSLQTALLAIVIGSQMSWQKDPAAGTKRKRSGESC